MPGQHRYELDPQSPRMGTVRVDAQLSTPDLDWLRYWQSFGQACAQCGRVFELCELRRPYGGPDTHLRVHNRPCVRDEVRAWTP
jgi:hypothetical protein